MESADWRRTRLPVFRQSIINTIVNSIIYATGMRSLHVQNYVANFEQEIYNLASSQLDYATRIFEEIASFEKNFCCHLDISYHRGGQNPFEPGSQKQRHGSHVQTQNVTQQCSMYQPQQRLNLMQEVFQQPTQDQGNMMQPHGTPFNMMQPQRMLHSTPQEQDQQSSQMMVNQLSSHGIKQMHAQMKNGVQYGQQRQLRLHTELPEASLSELEAYNGSAAQTHQNAIEFVEDAYKKLQSLKEEYYMDIHNIYATANEVCEQFGGGKRQISFRETLGNILEFLKLSKNDIITLPDFEVNLGRCKEQILRIISTYKQSISSAEQPKTPVAASVSVKARLQQLDNQTQSINMQSSPATVATAKGAHYSQHFKLNTSEPAQNMILAHENAFVSSPQNVMNSFQRSIVSGVQQGGMSEQPPQRQFHQPGQPMAKVPQINENNNDAKELTIQTESAPKSGSYPDLHRQQSQPMQHMPQNVQMNVAHHQFLQSNSPQKSQASTPQNMDVGTSSASSPSTLPSPSVNTAKFPAASHSPATVLSPINMEINSPTPRMPSVSNLGNVGSEQATQENTHLLVNPLSPDKLRSVAGNETILVGAEDLEKKIKTDVDATLVNAPSPVNVGNISVTDNESVLIGAENLAVVTDRKRPSPDSPGDSSPSAKKIKTDIDAMLLNAPSPVNIGNRSVTGNESTLIGAEDLVVVGDRKRQSQDLPDNSSTSAKKIRRDVDATLVNSLSPVNVGNSDNFGLSSSFESPELESTATSRLLKVNEAEAKQYSLIDEIEDINNLELINTVVEISDENAEAAGGEGTIVKCTYTASVSRQLNSHLDASPMQRSLTLRLLVPTSYPGCSPVPLDELPAETSDQIEDFSGNAKALFDIVVSELTHYTLAEIIITWHSCARQATRYSPKK